MKVKYIILHDVGMGVERGGGSVCDEHFEPVVIAMNYRVQYRPQYIYQLFSQHRPKLIITKGNADSYKFMEQVSWGVQRFWRHVSGDTEITSALLDRLYAEVSFRGSCSSSPALFSVFTTTFNTRGKISIPYESLRAQSYPHWEWVIFDDSDSCDTWDILVDLANRDPRVRVYKGHRNNGYIGEVKKLACSLCRGEFMLEMDHDDELHPECLSWIHQASCAYPDAQFFHTDCIEMFENTRMCHTYGDTYAFGCAGHYHTLLHGWATCEGRWITGQRSSPINHMTLRYIVGIPNHVRAWKRKAYWELEGHCENLAVADDYELVLRTFLNYPSVYIREIGYLQYRNEEGNNFTFLRNSLIQRKTKIVAAHYNEDIRAFLEHRGLADPSYHGVQYGRPNWQIVSPDDHPNIGHMYVPGSHAERPLYPWIAVIIPTCNNIAKLNRALQSVFAQTYPYWKLYIVGNKCPELDNYMHSNLQMFLQKSKNNKIMYWNFQKEPYGMYACKNYAIRNMIDDEWVTYLEDSYYWNPDHLQSLVDTIAENPSARYVYSGIRAGTSDCLCDKPAPFGVEPSNLLHRTQLLREKGYWMHPKDVHYTDAWELIEQWFDEPYASTTKCTVLTDDESWLPLFKMAI